MDLIAVGKITKPVGTRGDVKILPFADDSGRFTGLKTIWVGRDDTQAKECDLLSIRVDADRVVARFNGVESVTEAEEYREKFVFVPKEQAVKLQPGSYFVDEIVGCEVVTEDLARVGTVTDLLALPAHDVWVVWNGKKEILIPAVKEIIRHVDLERRRISVQHLEGLLE